MSFLHDIHSNNTNVYPIVTLEPPGVEGGWMDRFNRCKFFSTNNVSLEHIHMNGQEGSPIPSGTIHHFKPLLSKMPTINQSIDTKTRRFKVSNVTLNILNNEYSGGRFSDLFDDDSLINWRVSIQFVSPSANIFSTIYPVWGNEISFYQAHSGNHGGITINETFYPAGVPYQAEEGQGYEFRYPKMTRMAYQGKIRDAYQNKESVTLKLEDMLGQRSHDSIPNVFTGYSGEIPEKYRGKPIPIVFGEVERSPLVVDESEGDLYVICDDPEATSKFYYTEDNAILTSNPLKILRDNAYVTVFSSNDDITSAYTIVEDSSKKYTDTVQYTYSNDSPSIKIQKHGGGTLLGPLMDNLAYCEVVQSADTWYLHQSANNYTQEHSPGEYVRYENQGVIFSDVEISRNDVTLTDPDGQAYTILMKVLRFDLGFPAAPGRIITQTLGEVTASLLERIAIYFSGHCYHNQPSETGDSGYINIHFETKSVNGWPTFLGSDFQTSVYDDDVAGELTDWGTPLIGTVDVTLNDYVWGGDEEIGVGDKYITTMRASYTAWSGGAVMLELQMDNDVYPISRNLNYFISDFFESDFYGHILGRTVGGTLIQNPITIMKYIVEKFLDAEVDQESYAIALAEHATWKFNFTINEEINTKKLLEDMAQSTKCFVRFNEGGQLAFYTIKTYYRDTDWWYAASIEDAISYKFNLSSLSEVVSKIDLEYAKDHGLNKYLKKTDTINHFGTEDDSAGYYGITDENANYKKLKSDYISDSETANKLLEFNYNYYKNRRLQVDLTLGMNHSNITVGSLIKFPGNELLGGIKAQGINYGDFDLVNGQWRMPMFIVNSVKMGAKDIKIKAEQVPNLEGVWDWFG